MVLLSTLLLVGGLLAPPAGAAAGGKETKLAEQLVKKVKASNANRHLIAFQRIADANGGNRASATATQIETPDSTRSVAYVVSQVKAAGFDYEVQEFSYLVEVSLASSLSVAGGGTFEIIRRRRASRPRWAGQRAAGRRSGRMPPPDARPRTSPARTSPARSP